MVLFSYRKTFKGISPTDLVESLSQIRGHWESWRLLGHHEDDPHPIPKLDLKLTTGPCIQLKTMPTPAHGNETSLYLDRSIQSREDRYRASAAYGPAHALRYFKSVHWNTGRSEISQRGGENELAAQFSFCMHLGKS